MRANRQNNRGNPNYTRVKLMPAHNCDKIWSLAFSGKALNCVTSRDMNHSFETLIWDTHSSFERLTILILIAWTFEVQFRGTYWKYPATHHNKYYWRHYRRRWFKFKAVYINEDISSKKPHTIKMSAFFSGNETYILSAKTTHGEMKFWRIIE